MGTNIIKRTLLNHDMRLYKQLLQKDLSKHGGRSRGFASKDSTGCKYCICKEKGVPYKFLEWVSEDHNIAFNTNLDI